MDISKAFVVKEFASFWKEQPALSYFGESKFDYDKQVGDELSFIKGAESKPVIMSLSTYGAKTIALSYGDFELQKEKMPFFKNKYPIDEQLIMTLQNLEANASTAVNSIIAKIFARSDNLRKHAALTRELLRMQALTTGVVSLKSNGVAFTADYGVPTGHKGSPTVKWDVTATADPVGDIEDWIQKIVDDTGVRPTEMLLNSATLGKLRKVESIRTGYFANSNATGNPTSKQVQQYLEDSLQITIYTDDDQYKDGTTNKKMVPDGTVVLMPDYKLGRSVFGTTPEEARLPDVEVVDMGVALTREFDRDAVEDSLKASQIFLPSFEHADEIFIASVLTA